MKIAHLKCLIALSEEGSFQAASRRLNISQPALSRTIIALEQECGETLFDRTRRGIHPTTFLRAHLNDVRRVIYKFSELQRNLTEGDCAKEGPCKFGVTPMLGATLLPKLLNVIGDQSNPRIRVLVDGGEYLIKSLQTLEIDFVVGSSHADPKIPTVNSENWIKLNSAFCVREHHPLMRKSFVTLDDITKYVIAGINEDPPGLLYGCKYFSSNSYDVLNRYVLNSDAVLLHVNNSAFTLPGIVHLDIDSSQFLGNHYLSLFTARDVSLSPSARNIVNIIKIISLG